MFPSLSKLSQCVCTWVSKRKSDAFYALYLPCCLSSCCLCNPDNAPTNSPNSAQEVSVLYPLTNTIVFSFKNPRRQFRQSARYITTNLQLESMCALPVWLPAYWIWIYVCLNISICAWITLTGSEIRCQRDCQINHLYIYIYHIESFRRIDLAFRVPDNFEPHPYGIDMQWYGTHNRMQ